MIWVSREESVKIADGKVTQAAISECDAIKEALDNYNSDQDTLDYEENERLQKIVKISEREVESHSNPLNCQLCTLVMVMIVKIGF